MPGRPASLTLTHPAQLSSALHRQLPQECVTKKTAGPGVAFSQFHKWPLLTVSLFKKPASERRLKTSSLLYPAEQKPAIGKEC